MFSFKTRRENFMPGIKPLEASQLYTNTRLDGFQFQTTDDLEPLNEAIGQPRAVEAVRFGIGINQNGYNIFALGPTGMGKRSLILRSFQERASQEPVPSDWVYVYNFKEKHRPRAIQLPPGIGSKLQREMDVLIDELRTALTAAFESDEYQARKQVIAQELQDRQEKALEALQLQARERNFSLLRTPGGLVFAPLRDGEVLAPEEFQKLPEEERKAVEHQLEELQAELQKLLQQVPAVQREVRERLKSLNREIVNLAVGGLMEEIRGKYTEFQEVGEYLNEVREDVIENSDDLLADERGDPEEGQNPVAALMARARAGQPSPLQRYKVNLLVDHSQSRGAPVIYEDNPTYQNLVGQVEFVAQMGALVTDFTLIRPGALHRANGGYLILDARKVLQNAFAWDALKRVLQSCLLKIESLGQMLSLISTVSLEPEPIPLDVKIALYGDRMLYYLLSNLDPDFGELFKVQADFDEIMDRNDGNQQVYARLIASLARNNHLRPFDRSAVARIIEHSARMVGDSEQLSTCVQDIADLMREADYWAGSAGQPQAREQKGGQGNGAVTAADVQKAIDQQVFRADRLREREQETILRGIWLIDTQSEKIGQVNGLSVIQLGSFAFGRPSRITARVWMGRGQVINIEREVELSGPIHSKGVLILGSFLSARYATDRPLSLSASLVFEQSYSGVEGDSASSAELYALLSAIAEAPVRQGLAVTGSVNQHGQVQAIGGVNEKIEGFFDICNARGLTGDQGVLIPASNVKHLMLRQDVREAVSAGKFAIFPVETVDQGIELLTGIPAGEQNQDGLYPEGTINGRVQNRLEMLAEKQAERQARLQGKQAENADGAREDLP
jgi:lon-related putative ATP-dependent protease